MMDCGLRASGEHWFFETAFQKLLHVVEAWRGLGRAGYLTESVKLTNDHSEDREPTQDYHLILVTKPKISAFQGSLKKAMNSTDQTTLYPVLN